VEAAANTSLVLDELNQLRTFGSNEQGLLGDNSDEDFRPYPSKLGKQFLLNQVLMLRSGMLEVDPQISEQTLCTFSFMNELGEIFVWGSFGIPLKGA